MGLDILGGVLGNLGNLVRLRPRQPVTGARNRDQLVRNARRRQFGGHVLRFRVGDVSVRGAVDQERGRILGRHVANRAIRLEPFGLGVRIVARDFVGPDALLATVQVESPRWLGVGCSESTRLPTQR